MKRHPLDAPSLVFGLLFTTLGVAALADAIDFDLLTLDWLWPAVLIGSGIAVLLTLGSREPSPDQAGGAVDTVDQASVDTVDQASVDTVDQASVDGADRHPGAGR